MLVRLVRKEANFSLLSGFNFLALKPKKRCYQ